MRKAISVNQAKEFDQKAQNKFGMPVLLLMENAGRAVAQEAMKTLKKKSAVCVFCGKGNNGGDGFVAARHLLTYGIKVRIFLAGNINDVSGHARINLDILLKSGADIFEVNEANLPAVKRKMQGCGLIIDALLGVGLSGQVRGVYPYLIDIINSAKAYVLSVDIPSGLDADNGKILGACVKADKTVTFIARKKGMLLKEGPKNCGRIVVKDLGILVANWF